MKILKSFNLRKLNDINLRNKLLLLYIIFLFIPIVFTNILFYRKISEEVKLAKMDQISWSMEKTKSEFKRLIIGGMTLSHAIYKDKNLDDLLDQHYSSVEEYFTYYNRYLRDLLKKYLMAYNSIEDISIYSNNYSIPAADSYYRLDSEVEQTSWYKNLRTIKNSILVSSSIKTGAMASERKVSIIRELDSPSKNSYIKILKIDLNYKMITQIISEQNLYGKVFLLNEDNNIVYSTDSRYMSDPAAFTPFSAVKAGRHEFVINLGLDDTTSLSGWRIVGIFEEKKITEALFTAVVFVTILSLISLSAATLAIVLIARSFNSRIFAISRHMKSVKNQEFDLIEEYGGTDEIGLLMSDFNSMALKIKKLIQDVYETDIQKKNLQLERKQAELNALQSQINPHFLFNTLESIRIRSLLKNETETAEIIKYLSRTFRRMLVWGNDLVTIRSENEFIISYLKIQKYRFADKLNYEISVPDEVMDYTIPKMTLQPFIENSCSHGIERKSSHGMLKLKVNKAEDRLIFIIEDNGCGIASEKLDNILNGLEAENVTGENIGIRNVYNRLKLFYGNQFIFNMESKLNEGTRVYISIPEKV